MSCRAVCGTKSEDSCTETGGDESEIHCSCWMGMAFCIKAPEAAEDDVDWGDLFG